VVITQQVDDAADIEYDGAFPAPLGFPVTTAYWIWPNADTAPQGKGFFHRDFELPTELLLTFTATADNYYTVYLDGTPIFGEAEDTACWREYKTVQFVVTAGWHNVAALVRNTAPEGGGANPAGFLCALYTVDGNGEPDTVYVQTDAEEISGDWKTLWVPEGGQDPGWTAGEIIIDMLEEAVARGVLTPVTVDFTATTDSEGNPWPVIPAFAVDVGSSVLSALADLARLGHIDWRMKPGAPVLQMFVHGLAGAASPATYAYGSNIASMSFEQASAVKNRILVKWSGGYFQVDDLASQAALGAVLETTMSIDAATQDEALRRAEEALADLSSEVRACVLTIELGDDISAMNPNDMPYFSFGVIDTITAPNEAATPTVSPVESITVNGGDNGDPEITLELNRRMRIPERAELELLYSIGSGIRGQVESSDPLIRIRSVSERN
jgi:hypothetical protein